MHVYLIPVSSAECERHFSVFNAHNIITKRNKMCPKAVEAVSVVLEGYKTRLLKQINEITINLSQCHCMACMYHNF